MLKIKGQVTKRVTLMVRVNRALALVTRGLQIHPVHACCQ